MAVKWEYEVGPLTLNFRVLLEPKGFLRIIMVIISILVFSLTAGFTNDANSNSLSCTSPVNTTREVMLEFAYPFRASNFRAVYDPTDEFIMNITRDVSSCQSSRGFENRSFAGFAQFFVAVGVFSFLYCLGILFVYVMFINPKLPFAKWILVFDFITSIIFAFFYLLADILWSAGIAGMDTYVDSELIRRGEKCLLCPGRLNADSGIYGQPAISVVLGWLLCFVWVAILWFLFKDTEWHKDRTGPLAADYAPDQSGTKTSETGVKTGETSPPPAPAPETVTGTY